MYFDFTNSFLIFQSASNANVEQEIVQWVNTKLESAQKDSKIHSFQDSKIATAKPIIDLIDAIKPGVINYELLQEGGSYEVIVIVIVISLKSNFKEVCFLYNLL